MKILILGAKGSLGQTFLDVYKSEDVTAWDRDELDITDQEMVAQKVSELSPELVLNCAAYNAVDQAEKDRETAVLINGTAVGYLALAAKDVGATLVHFSSAYVFDGNNQEGYNEDDATRPVSAYGQSKLEGELELASNMDNYYLIRTTWLYGRNSVTGKPSFVDLMLRLATEGKTISGIADEFGQPTYVLDLARAVKKLVEQKRVFGIYHFTNSGSASWYDWANEIFRIKNLNPKFSKTTREDFPRIAKRPKYGVLNNTKFELLRPWTEALKEHLANL
jgi:dTDP-4-dehydrorhamnose reductase